jgi:hypothetical protein
MNKLFIIGYGIDLTEENPLPFPIFQSEKQAYKQTIYKSIEDAKKAIKRK